MRGALLSMCVAGWVYTCKPSCCVEGIQYTVLYLLGSLFRKMDIAITKHLPTGKKEGILAPIGIRGGL